MSYTLKQTRRFARSYKKLHDNVAADVDVAAEVVAADPTIGEKKKGDLLDLFVYKFRSQNQLYLLGYTVDDEVRLVYLEAIGTHENMRTPTAIPGVRSLRQVSKNSISRTRRNFATQRGHIATRSTIQNIQRNP